VLDVGDVGAVALAGQLAGLVVEVDLRDQEEAQPLGARAARALDAHGACEHEVHDVLAHVVLGRGDEALDALDVPRAVVVRGGLGPAGTHVGAGVRLGEHHGAAPLAVDHVLGDPLVAVVAVAVDDVREGGAGGVHPDGGVRAEHQLAEGPHQARGGGLAAELLEDLQAPPLGVHPRLVALLERLGDRRRVGRRVEDRRVAVAVLVGLREVLAREAVDLGEDRAGGLAVDLRERAAAQDFVATQHLEEVELDVAQVALVVAH
jgi:hypothetical protein